MPQIGLGTFDLPKDRISEIIGTAYRLGYRKFDTAFKYNNEIEIGLALKKNGIRREDIFLQTKLDGEDIYMKPYHSHLRWLNLRKPISWACAIEQSMKRLGTDYIDMFLVHGSWTRYIRLWQALEKFYKAGEIRAIGVSNFLPPHLDWLSERCTVTPTLNQVEISPLNSQKRLIENCRARGIVLEAASVFSHFRSSEPRMEIMNHEMLRNIAEQHNRTVPQIVYRWLIQQGISIVPKSKSPRHLAENISLDDFVLSEEEMTAIDSLDKGKFLNYDPSSAVYSVPKKYRKSEWFR